MVDSFPFFNSRIFRSQEGMSISNSHYVLYDRYQCDNESQIRSCIKQCVLVSQKLKTRLNFLDELGPAYRLALERLDLEFTIPNHEHVVDQHVPHSYVR